MQPRTSAGVFVAHLWGSELYGVRQREWIAGISVELALGRVGAFLELPMVWDSLETEGVYGPGGASAAGAGDLRFGVDVLLHTFRWQGFWWYLGTGIHVAAPTSEARQVEPDTPYLAAPPVELGSGRWTVSLGPALAVTRPSWGLSAQLNSGLTAQVRSSGHSWHRNPQLFADVALSVIYQPLWWLAPMMLWDIQLELYGEPELRQLVFFSPALRVKPHRSVSVDLGLRIPIREETTRQQRLSLGINVSVELGDLLARGKPERKR